MRYLILLALLAANISFASLAEYIRPADEAVFNGSDVVAIVRTIQGEVIPLEQGGGIKVTAKVLYPIKGIMKGAEIQIFYGAGSIGGRYVATLIWDPELKGYKYFDSSMSYEVFHINTIKQSFLNPSEIAEARGFRGEISKSLNGIYYLPSCYIPADEYCQEAFNQIQYLVGKNK